MTEYVIKEIGPHQWLVFADRQSIALCADEIEAVKAMTEHSVRSRRPGNTIDCCPEQKPAGDVTGGLARADLSPRP
jgi:hypothetical protein